MPKITEFRNGLFGRKRSAPSRSATDGDSGATLIGRKFRSSLSVEDYLENYSAVKKECYDVEGPLADVEWHMPATFASLESTQGIVPATPPVRVVASDLAGGGRIYLAVWASCPTYAEADSFREMWFCPARVRYVANPYRGKMEDARLITVLDRVRRVGVLGRQRLVSPLSLRWSGLGPAEAVTTVTPQVRLVQPSSTGRGSGRCTPARRASTAAMTMDAARG